MPDTSRSSSAQHSPSGGAPKLPGGRQRIISSCLTCRRRKVRCDHVHPVCGACARGNHVCTYATDQTFGAAASSGPNRVTKNPLAGHGNISKSSKNGDVQARLDRLELLLEKAVAGKVPEQNWYPRHEEDRPDADMSPSANSQASHGAGMSSDNNDGTLLLDGGQSKFVSSLHYALLADEVGDPGRRLCHTPDSRVRSKTSKLCWAIEPTRVKINRRRITSFTSCP